MVFEPEITINLAHVAQVVIPAFITGWIAWIYIEDKWRIFYQIRNLFENLWNCSLHQIQIWRKQYTENEIRLMENPKDIYGPGEDYEGPRAGWWEVSYNWNTIISILTNPYYTVKHGLRNLIYYLPVIWHDSWFDQSYLLDLIHRKVSRDAPMYEKRGIAQGSGDVAAQLKELARLCKAITDETSGDHLYAEHEKKWGSFPKHLPPDLKEIEGQLFSNAAKEAERLIDEDVKKLSELFLKIRTWWD